MTKKSEATKEVAEVTEDEERIHRTVRRGLMAHRSVRQIAEEAGIKPERVLRIRDEMIEGADELDVRQKRLLLTAELTDMARETRERASRTHDEFYAGMVNSSVAAIKTYLAELSRMDKMDQSKVESLNQKRIQELVSLMREVVDISVVEIAGKHGLDEQELYEIFNRRMTDAAQKRDLG